MTYQPATKPTFYFIGVTTGQSSIMRVFPRWAEHLGLGDVAIQGIDLVPHDSVQNYREVVDFIANDRLSLGALVTTHKLDLFAACRDMFDEVDPHATLMAETSCLSKRNGRLVCHAKDPISAGLALDAFVPANHFAQTRADVFSMGAGGSTIAITWHLMASRKTEDRPSRLFVSDRSQSRLDHLSEVHEKIGAGLACEYVLASAEDNDAVLAGLKPGSLVINATGLGKDAPGSPLSDAATFPQDGLAWDLNYRGDLVFLDRARRQAADGRLQVTDGWRYFIHGWTEVIAEVFDIEIAAAGPEFEAISRIAADATGRGHPVSGA